MKAPIVAGCCMLILLFPSVRVHAGWQPLDGGVDQRIEALAVHGDEMIAGGQFTHAAGQPTPYIARWDGVLWSPMGSGMDMWVYALTSWNGLAIAGGVFTHSDGLITNHIAQWNGVSWAPMGSGMDASVYALGEYDGRLIAGGAFGVAGDVPCSHIAQWDGSSWGPLGGGVDGRVYTFGTYNGRLIAGGGFLHAEGSPAQAVAQWDGFSWSAIGDCPVQQVHAICEFNGDLIVGGFTQGGSGATFIARWNGVEWTRLGSVGGTVYALALFNNELIAGGSLSHYIRGWNGETWHDIAGGWSASIYDLLTYRGNLVVGGDASAQIVLGACCLPDATCEISYSVLDCPLPNDWQGDGTVCDPNPCYQTDPGACCHRDGTCTFVQHLQCQAPDLWMGEGTNCLTNPCGTPAACCYFEGQCIYQTRITCESEGGSFQGDGTDCDPPPCPNTSVDADTGIPSRQALSAVPNPSTGRIVIAYDLPRATAVTIEIFNAAGSLVRRMLEGARAAGQHEVDWDGRDDRGNALPSGVYLARIVAEDGITTGRVVLTR